MSVGYVAVGWSRQKRVYDTALAVGVVGFVAVFYLVGKLTSGGPDPTAVHDDAMLLIRGLGVAGLVLLHVVLWIGPLARLDWRLLPLLYNRRHLGVTTFLVGLAHAAMVMAQYHAFGDVNPLVSLLTSNTNYGSVSAFPFEMLGLVALVILFLMAATSHDFWLAVLSARVWKWLHMGVYVAYAALVGHVALGALQQERSPVLAGLLIGGAAVTVVLHVLAGRVEGRGDRGVGVDAAGLVDVGAVEEIPLDRARVVCVPSGERVAVFRYRDGEKEKVSAVSNVCAHQQGPLGEGKVVDGCITCPWHGYQYRPGDGCAPPPFTEKIATFRVSVRGGRVLVDPRGLAPGTAVEPAVIEPSEVARG